MGSGLIYAVILGAWVIVGIQYLARRHDESSESRSIDRFSNAMRVLSRRGPKVSSGSRYVVMPPRDEVVEVTVSGPATPETSRRKPPIPARTATSARARAARRRRRILYGILLVTITVSVAAGMSRLPWWSVAASVFVLIGYLFLLRSGVRSTVQGRSPRRPVRSPARPVPQAPASRAGEHGDREPATSPAPSATEEDPSDPAADVWRPIPIHVPTYVNKPKATRAVRTIDLTAPGAWSQGISIQIQRPMPAVEPLSEQHREPEPAEASVEQLERPLAVND